MTAAPKKDPDRPIRVANYSKGNPNNNKNRHMLIAWLALAVASVAASSSAAFVEFPLLFDDQQPAEWQLAEGALADLKTSNEDHDGLHQQQQQQHFQHRPGTPEQVAPGERRRRVLPAGGPSPGSPFNQRLMALDQQLSAIQSLDGLVGGAGPGQSGDGDEMLIGQLAGGPAGSGGPNPGRTYKPRTISTARGFGKRSMMMMNLGGNVRRLKLQRQRAARARLARLTGSSSSSSPGRPRQTDLRT